MTTNNIIFLVAPPRSLSTTFLRVMAYYDAIKLMNEPACGVFNKMHYPYSQHMYAPNALATYQEVSDAILLAAEHQTVFVKEMSFSFEEFMRERLDFIKNPKVFFVFLLRDPHPCIISYYKKISPGDLDYLMPHIEELTGFRALYHGFKRVQQEAINKPYVVHAEHLWREPEVTMNVFCDYVGLPFDRACLSWVPLAEQFTGFQEWQESKKIEFTRHWHHDAMVSQGFHQPGVYDMDENHQPTFDEIHHPVHKSQCIKAYQQSKMFYDLIH